ncbi:hypothetical protein OTK49_00045 [Vibrio coralliirubri]|uniref:radical SAM protein n=1 Tax=Vibrio coralliirubri TaxID=1516159 RepID=UPI002283B5D7|nr:hypothetical protein [Vibrio coralliirubri]MCY9860930.1 hypothetical protein [Vibrio coralliirubri]
MFSPESQVSIESGYLILTMMPSLFCAEKCPHCYLSKEQRNDKTVMSLVNIELVCNKIIDYYNSTNVKDKHIVLYWYGGEPTSMGIQYFTSAINIINRTLSPFKGYTVKHVVLTSLVNIDTEWFSFFDKYCDGYFQTSYDGRMRGKKYLEQWELRVKEAKEYGLNVGTISVVNEEMLKIGARQTIEYLTELKVSEAGFLPFMLNEQNKGKKFDRFAPTMSNWSEFMIELTKRSREMAKDGHIVPTIGQELFYFTQKFRDSAISNCAAQTLFLMPNGDLTLPDYKNGHEEYMRPFGNILNQSFKEVLFGSERITYLTKQLTRNYNQECLECPHSNYCVMEFWKENRAGDDCFGGNNYMNWLNNNNESRYGDVSRSIIN